MNDRTFIVPVALDASDTPRSRMRDLSILWFDGEPFHEFSDTVDDEDPTYWQVIDWSGDQP